MKIILYGFTDGAVLISKQDDTEMFVLDTQINA